jgi:hypothetical protein
MENLFLAITLHKIILLMHKKGGTTAQRNQWDLHYVGLDIFIRYVSTI